MNTMRKIADKLWTAIALRLEPLRGNRGEGYVDTIVKMAIAVVVGALILTVLLAIIGDENSGLMQTIKTALEKMFDQGNSNTTP